MLKPGMFISDRYEIIDKVGSGGMADVYKARCHRLNRFVAIKVLKPEYSNDKSFVNKFRGEAQSAAGLSHPNIVNVYDVGDDGGLHYIVMELVEGITLKRFIERKGKLEVKEAVGIAVQIAQGMEAAHDNHIIHRDIKPQNIIISRDGKVKVTDFGIAKATTSNTITSNAMGSVHYLSPEQARGGYSDEKSDIYSLGVTLYEMLSGKVPFAGDNTVSVALLHIQGEATPLRELDPEIPLSIDKIVQKCMQKRPERRYHTASELIVDLKKAITNPNGDFVHIPIASPNDSPTINISDDLSKIKSGAYLDESAFDTKRDAIGATADSEDDEELDTVDTKVEKVFLIGSIAAVVILGLTIIFLVGWFFGFWGNSDKDGKGDDTQIGTDLDEDDLSPTPGITEAPSVTPAVTGDTFVVPSVENLTLQDAKDKIAAKSPTALVVSEEEYSDDYEKGRVISQYPIADSEVALDETINLVISLGPEPFALPNVYNLTEEQADKMLNEVKLEIRHEYPNSDEIEAGRVISTNPEKETMVVKGTTVIVYISSGPETTQVSVPDLIGKTESEAERLLNNAGLKKGSVSYEPSDTTTEGKVTYQSNTAGQKVEAGSAIDIMVSTGPEEAEVDPDATYRYVGSVTIDINPFDYIDESEASIVLDLEQDGSVTPIYDEYSSITDFPLSITDIEGTSDTPGIVRMYVDDVLFKLDGQSEPMTWTVNFDVVEE
ncbi:MAG: hypothetical protein K0S47_1506 [Herbinix sp.]|jgi:serine/threonine-protein kinase|nr:hypothetical protein [Herbinix sp.]